MRLSQPEGLNNPAAIGAEFLITEEESGLGPAQGLSPCRGWAGSGRSAGSGAGRRDDAAGLSATNIARLTNEWEAEYRAFQKRSLRP